MRWAWKVAVGIALGLTLAGTGLGVAHTAWLEDHELWVEEQVSLAGRAGSAGSSESSARLLVVELERGQSVVFEVCADDRMDPERWLDAVSLAVWRPREGEVVTRTEMTEEVLALVRRDATHGCLTLGRGELEVSGDYAIDALWEEGEPRPQAIEDTTLTVRVVARPVLGGTALLAVLLTWLGSILSVVALALPRPEPAPREDGLDPPVGPTSIDDDPWRAEMERRGPRLPDWARVLIGLVLVVGAFVASGFLPSGAALALATGIGLGAFEIAVGLGLAEGWGLRERFDRLALRAPKRWYAWFPGAFVAGVALVQIATLATRLVPSTSRSAIQTFVSWPSGMMSFAGLAVFAPLAEEVFFRGFVYGTLEAKRGRAVAFLGGWLLFVVAHLPQTFGQWGALVGITVTGLALTGLRALSGSALVAALAHLVYNGLLALSGLL